MGLGMHLPVTSGLRQEVQLLLLCPNTYVDSSSPFSLLSTLEFHKPRWHPPDTME